MYISFLSWLVSFHPISFAWVHLPSICKLSVLLAEYILCRVWVVHDGDILLV